jgi:hypothetical protein
MAITNDDQALNIERRKIKTKFMGLRQRYNVKYFLLIKMQHTNRVCDQV